MYKTVYYFVLCRFYHLLQFAGVLYDSRLISQSIFHEKIDINYNKYDNGFISDAQYQ